MLMKKLFVFKWFEFEGVLIWWYKLKVRILVLLDVDVLCEYFECCVGICGDFD